MFARKYHLSVDERRALVNIRQRLLHAISSRLHDPASFDANLKYLKIYEGFIRAYDALAKSHLKTIAQGSQSAHHSCFSFANAIFGNAHDPLHFFQREAAEIIFTQSVMQSKKQHLDVEPRIKILDFTLSYEKKRSVKNGREIFTPIEKLEYTILFSDGDQLILNKLDDEAELAQGREIFENKMLALSQHKRLGYL